MEEYLNAQVPGTGGQGYSYDRYGNRSVSASGEINSQQFAVDANTNRRGVPAGQSGTMAYDSAGNLTTDTYSGAGTRAYDAENRMITATAGDNTNEYTYDGNGRRVRRYVATDDEETWQVYGLGGELMAEYDAEDNWPSDPTKEYGYRNGELLIVAEVYTPPPPPPICYYDWEEGWICYPVDSNPELRLHWLLTDQLGTPRMIFDQTGNLSGVSRHDYLPFGEELFAGSRSGQLGYTNNDGTRQKFTQKERDNETELDYFINRYYSSMQGRFTTADPIPMTTQRPPDPQRLNLFAYVRNNPLVATDPNGLELDVRGNEAFSYLASLERTTGLKLKLNKKGVVTIVSKPKQLSKDAQKIVGIIESKAAGDLVRIEATRNRSDVLGGQFWGGGEQTIDFGDLRTEQKAGRGGFTVDSSVMHETIEAIEGRHTPNTLDTLGVIKPFHSMAIDAENAVRQMQGLAPRVKDSDKVVRREPNGDMVLSFDFTTHTETLTLEGKTGTIKKAEVRKKQ